MPEQRGINFFVASDINTDHRPLRRTLHRSIILFSLSPELVPAKQGYERIRPGSCKLLIAGIEKTGDLVSFKTLKPQILPVSYYDYVCAFFHLHPSTNNVLLS